MRAVNLIPAEQQRGAGGAAGRSGGGAYALLGGLAVVVAMTGVYVETNKSLTDKQDELSRVTRQAEAAEARSQALQSYTKFSALRDKRVQTVSQIAASRFDWSHSLREVARVLPTNAWLTSLTGTTSPSVSVGGGSSSSGLRASLPVPAIEIQGCTTSQSSVATMMTRLRLIDGVQSVSLDHAEKADAPSGGSVVAPGGPASSGGDCRGASSHFPQFDMVVFYKPSAVAVPSATPATTTASAVTSSASSATPSSTTPGG